MKTEQSIMMNNTTITRLLHTHRQTRELFKGVYASDQIPVSKPQYKTACYVLNLDPIRLPGSHWVAVYLNPLGINEYFDSYGLKPSLQSILKLLGPIYRFNAEQIQSPLTTVCGQYCIFYVWNKSLGIDMESMISIFSNDYPSNDSLVNRLIEHEFNVDLDIIEPEFIRSQISSKLSRYKILQISDYSTWD